MLVFIALVFGILTIFLYWCYGIYRKNKMLEKIPGPPPIPFFGIKLPRDVYGLFDMFDAFTETYGKTCKVYIGESLQILTSDMHLIEDLMKSPIHTKKSIIYGLFEPWLKNGLILSDGPKWRHRRKLCAQSFNFSLMQDNFTIFKKNTDTVIYKLGKAADKGDVINVVEYTSLLTLAIVGETSFGVKLKTQEGDRNEYVKAVENFTRISFEKHFSIWKQFSILLKFFAPKMYALQEESLNILNGTAMKIIKENREHQRNNQVKNTETQDQHKQKSILIHTLMQQEELSDADILEEANNFLFAGHDTTSAGVAFAVFELSKQPEIQKRLYEEIISHIHDDIERLTMDNLQEMKYLDMVVKEVLRFWSPLPLIERQLDKEALLGNTVYPKGTVITILLYWLHHDKDHFPDPYKFDPERFSPENQAKLPPFAFVPFSAGLRNCIGQKYAMLEMKTVIARIVFEFSIHPVENFKLELGIASILRSKYGTPVILKRREIIK